MALVVATLKNDVKAAFRATDWTVCATQLAQAIDSFIKSGIANTTVTGIVTPPFPMPPYSAVGSGGAAPGQTSNITTTGLAALQAQITAKFMSSSTMWADLGSAIATAISSDVATATINTTVTGALTGTGVGNPGCINDSGGLSGLIANLTAAFTTQAYDTDWNNVADKIGDSLDQYLKAATVTTIDNGTIPPNSWAGSGTGTIS